MFKEVFIAVISFTMCAAAPQRSHAQSIAERAGHVARAIANQFLRRSDHSLQEQVLEQNNTNETEPEPAIPNGIQNASCMDVRKIDVLGYSAFSKDEIHAVTTPYEGQCLSKVRIVTLIRDLEQLYSNKGYKTARAGLQPALSTHNQLVFQVMEGHIDGVNYSVPGDQKERYELWFLRRWLESREFLNLYDLEHSVERLERLPSNHVTFKIRSGETNGGSLVDIYNTPTKRWYGSFGINNHGLASTGELQGDLRLNYDNPFGFNDQIRLGMVRSLNDEDSQDARSFSFHYSFPAAKWLFSYGLNYYEYISDIETPTQSFDTDGFSRMHTFGAQYALHRDKKTASTIQLSLEAKENENFISGFRLETSSQKQTIASIGLNHTRRYGQGYFYGGLTLARGLTSFGAREDQNPDPDEPHAQFNRMTLDFQHSHSFLSWARDDAFTPSGGKAYPRINITAHGQWADRTLFGSEQINIGGPSSVRGFKDTSIGGDIGGFLRTEISYPLPALPFVWSNKILGQLRPFIGFDAGGVLHDEHNPFERGGLTSATFGIGSDYGIIDINGAVSKTLSAPSFINADDYEAYVSLSVNF